MTNPSLQYSIKLQVICVAEITVWVREKIIIIEKKKFWSDKTILKNEDKILCAYIYPFEENDWFCWCNLTNYQHQKRYNFQFSSQCLQLLFLYHLPGEKSEKQFIELGATLSFASTMMSSIATELKKFTLGNVHEMHKFIFEYVQNDIHFMKCLTFSILINKCTKFFVTSLPHLFIDFLFSSQSIFL